MLNSQLEIVQQAQNLLKQIDIKDYCQPCTPHLSGSIGAHMRHIIDHYQALLSGMACGVVNYNHRNRGSQVAHCPQAAEAAWSEIADQLQILCARPENMPLQVVTEISLSETTDATVKSTLARELVFVSSHAIHHFSLLAIARSLQGQPMHAEFGVAPATATFLREHA